MGLSSWTDQSLIEDAGKLGYVLFQLAPWAKYSDEELARLAELPKGSRE